jgi:uncharacterized protein YegL
MAEKTLYDNVEGIVRRQMVMFFIIDVSGSMSGVKIGAVNTVIREILPELAVRDVDLKIAVLTFSSGYSWLYPGPMPVESVQWKNLEAGGATDLGAALEELNSKLSKHKFLMTPSASVAPVLFLVSDGQPTDNYEAGLEKLAGNTWYKCAIKAALAIGDDADIDQLAKFTRGRESVLAVHTPEEIRKWIRVVSITSTKIGSKSQPVTNGQQVQSKQSSFEAEMMKARESEQENGFFNFP